MDHKDRAFAQFAFCCDRTSMALHDLTADGQAHACSFIFIATVQALEHIEDAVQVYLFEADAIILH